MRKGIISMGTWLVDMVKFINRYPLPGNLTTIEKEEIGLGGCSHNVLVDLAKMKTGLPLYAGGCIGDDANGDYIIREITANNIDANNMLRIKGGVTSYTYVMAPLDGSSRTFFHYKGTNALLNASHFEPINVPAKIFHLGYLLLLDGLEQEDIRYKIVAAKVLCELQQKGYLTSVDVVSEESDRFRHIILPCLPYINYLIINEVEAGACFEESMREPDGKIRLNGIAGAAGFLLDQGVNDICVIHFPEGGYARNKKGESVFVPSIPLTGDAIVSTVGAGDAFCAGMLYALHEQLPLYEALVFANTSARFNLRHATCTGGAPTLREIEEFIRKI
jgi:sugar/nucleoside kinase (ribokinase family)